MIGSAHGLTFGRGAGAGVFLMHAVALAQGASRLPPVRDLGAVMAPAPMAFRAPIASETALRLSVVPLSDGRTLIADGGKRVVWLFDTAFANPRVVLDSAGDMSAGARPPRFSFGSVLIPYRSDSALFLDRSVAVLVVIDPGGRLVRAVLPPTVHASSIPGSAPSVPAFVSTYPDPMSSSALGMVYRMPVAARRPVLPAKGAPDVRVSQADSLFLVRWSYESHQTDTVATIGQGSISYRTWRSSGAVSDMGRLPDLLPFVDDAVVTTDGSIAIFHAHDYRIEWINPDGSRLPGQRLAYDWQPISEDGRQHIVDSVNAIRKHDYDSLRTKRAVDSANGKPPMSSAISAGPDGKAVVRTVPASPLHPPRYADLSEVPAFRPPTNRGAMVADRDNNVWIAPIPAHLDTAGTVWEVYDKRGTMVDRVRIPAGRTILAFGVDASVYLGWRDGAETRIVKVRLR